MMATYAFGLFYLWLYVDLFLNWFWRKQCTAKPSQFFLALFAVYVCCMLGFVVYVVFTILVMANFIDKMFVLW